MVAPRGCLTGTLELKAAKKKSFLFTARLSGLYRNVLWHASTPREADDIRDNFGDQAPIAVAPNLPTLLQGTVSAARPPKQTGELDLVFLSRISPEKNLKLLLNALGQARGRIALTVYGPVGDPDYWRECQRLIANLPPSVTVDYRGELPHQQVAERLGGHQVFVLPSLGENFGHAIAEALAAGCPVIVSDRTPWQQLESRRAGYDVTVESAEPLTRAVNRFVTMDAPAFQHWSEGARALWAERANDQQAVEANRSLFRQAMAGAPG